MERPRASLSLQIPSSLLPSSRAPDLTGSDSQDSLEEGLALRPVTAFGRSSSGPATASRPQLQGPLAPPQRSTTFPAGGKPAGAAIAVHVNAAAGGTGAQQGHADAASPTAPAAQRVGSRQPSHGAVSSSSSSSMAGDPATASLAAASEPSTALTAAPSVSQGAFSPQPASERYSEEFEAEEDSLQAAPASPGAAGSSRSAAASCSVGRPVERPASAAAGRAGSGVSPARSPSARQLSRSGSGRPSYLSSTAAKEAKRGTPTASMPSSRPGSASPPTKQPARPASAGRPLLEARVARQFEKDPADWTVLEVCDWLEIIGLGQYRRHFVHHAVCGSLLLALGPEELKTELGIGPLGHREGLLTAIHDLDSYWAQRQAEGSANDAGEGSQDGDWEIRAGCAFGSGNGRAGGSRSPSPPLSAGDYGLQRAYAQRARLMRDLEKAEAREAQRMKAAEQAQRVAGQASEEVRKLQASICELDRSLGWQGAAAEQRFDPLDVHGAVAWQPAGTQRAAPRPRGRPGSASPLLLGGGSPGSGVGGAMSPLSRRIMESSGAGGSFLQRLERDIEQRQAARAARQARAGVYVGGAAEQMAEREQERRDLSFVREAVEARSDELAQALGSDDPERVAQACEEIAEAYQQELGLSDEAVAAVKRLDSPTKRVARLAGAIRSAQFMARLQHDLATRETRLQELQHKYFKLEQGNTAEQQETADAAAAQAHFVQLGWPADDLRPAAGDESAGCDELLGALLKRAAALQEARQRGKPSVNWEQPEWKRDRLEELQAGRNAQLSAALAAQAAAAAAEEAATPASKRGLVPPKRKELPQPANYLGETVELLAGCRPAEVALLQSLSGYRKLLMTWRAVRGQKFVAFTRRDLEARKIKAAELERQLYPDSTRKLSKAEQEAFYTRLFEDTERRARNRDELAEKAKADALAKLLKTAPPPRRRPASAAAGSL